MRIEDPYEYRDRLTMPKFLVNATGDQFFLPDSWKFYLGDLPGETHVRYVPNADHGLKRHRRAQLGGGVLRRHPHRHAAADDDVGGGAGRPHPRPIHGGADERDGVARDQPGGA